MMNKYSKFSTSPITPSTKVAVSVPYAIRAAAAAKDGEPATMVDAPKGEVK